MSVTLFKLFAFTLRHNLPRIPVISGSQVRIISSAMELVKEKKQTEEIVKHKNHTRFKKRQWEWNQDKKETEESEAKRTCEPTERIKRKKVALMLGYCGVDYYGMQRNPGVRTIEEDLLKALYEAKYITEEDFNNQQNAQFQRSSRTDKGVSAARQVVSLKLPLEAKIEEINSRLPDCIKVFGMKRVTNKFNSKVKCNARTYSYTVPTYVFEPSICGEEGRKHYRISADKVELVNKVLAYYKGTKSYHNFTEKKHFQDPSSLRYMMNFNLEKVFVESDMEFAVLLVKGQSFMLHQIRKMVGLTIAIVRGHADISIMDRVFGKEKVMIPTAPGLGLVLDTVHYDRYDAKHKESHVSLTWNDEEESVQKFTHDHIYPVIVRGEIEDNSIGLWLEKLNRHSYDPADDVPSDKETEPVGDDDDDFEQDPDVKDKDDLKDKTKKSVEQNGVFEEKSENSDEHRIKDKDVTIDDELKKEDLSKT